jgi:hypothetical protein
VTPSNRHIILGSTLLVGLSLALLVGACSLPSRRHLEWPAGTLRLRVDHRGYVVRVTDLQTGHDYRADQVESPLLSLQVDGVLHAPRVLTWDSTQHVARLEYPDGLTAHVAVTVKPTHLVLEVVSVERLEAVELVVWGPYATTLSGTIGETVGVVRDSLFAIGIQALNPKTLGGFPWRDNDFLPQVDLFESGDFSDLSAEGKRQVLYRVEAAKPEDFGSTLQAYCRARSEERVIANWNHERYVAPALDDGGVIGSKIALFGSPTESALQILGIIEVEEGLPHPAIDGEWGKTARSAAAAYMILDFGEEDANDAIAWTRRAGLRYLYHPGPFETWGHFRLSDQFPNGRAGLRRIVERAAESGIYVGVHTLSNFITTNDPYVTPIPDPRLARVGSSTLPQGIDEQQANIPVASPDFFAQYENNTLRTVVIGNELVQYRTVSEQPPWQLLDCRRGAFGTSRAAHAAGDEVALLADHAYRVFLTNADLGREVATNIADLFNDTGLRQISFDGVEGNQSTGLGNYGEILFTTTWYEHLSEGIRRHYIADASRTTHFFWHVYTRMNWGEPWYAGFRESQTEYRLKNQPYFRRNYMPGMLGWFRMTSRTTIEDVEWMLARSAAFDAGYAFVTSYDALELNGFTDEILAAIGLWERLRMANAFSAAQKKKMEDIAREFHIEARQPEAWQLVEIHPQVFWQERPARQPGEPVSTTFSFDNPGTDQPLRWILTAENGAVSNIKLTIDDGVPVGLVITLPEDWSLRYEGGQTATVRDAEHRPRRRVVISEAPFRISLGRHSVALEGELDGDDTKLRVELRPRGQAEAIGRGG